MSPPRVNIKPIRRETLKSISGLEKSLAKVLKWATVDEVIRIQKKLTLDVLLGVIMNTPVDLGIARGGWRIGVSTPDDTVDDRSDISGNKVMQEEPPKLDALKKLDVVYVTNNVQYITVLDQGGFIPTDPGPSKDPRPGRKGKILVRGGYSVQAPNGMVDITIEQVAAQPLT